MNDVEKMSDLEKAILAAQHELEKAGASDELTEAATFLSKARELARDHEELTRDMSNDVQFSVREIILGMNKKVTYHASWLELIEENDK